MKSIESYPKALQTAIADIEKDFGGGSIFRLGDSDKLKVETIPFEILGLDRALGGGLPRGRIIEIYGPESSGKTTVCLEAIATMQKNGKTAAFVDVEHALDPGYAKKLNVNLDQLLFSQPNSGEEALNIVDILCKGGVDLIVLDSVAALVTKHELQGEIGDAVVGAQARIMSAALRKLTASISQNNTIVIFTNQIREKIGVMFGNPETTPGGKALKFYASIRMDIRRAAALKTSDGTVFGNRTKVKVVKNKVAPPYRTCEFEIHYGSGVSKAASLLEEALQLNIVKKRGSWIEYDGSMIGQGSSAAIKALTEDKELFSKLYKQLLAQEGEVASLDTPKTQSLEASEPIVETVSKNLPSLNKTINTPDVINPTISDDTSLNKTVNTPEVVINPTISDDMPPDVDDEDDAEPAIKNLEPDNQNTQVTIPSVSISVKEAIISYLHTVTSNSPSQIAEAISAQFPDRDIKALKNQVSVTMSTGAKKGTFITQQPGMYQLP